VSVDTYLKGKNVSGYRRVHVDDVTVLVAKPLTQLAERIELVTRKRLLGRRLVAVAHHRHTNTCRLHHH
jgi:hypothetical protein